MKVTIELTAEDLKKDETQVALAMLGARSMGAPSLCSRPEPASEEIAASNLEPEKPAEPEKAKRGRKSKAEKPAEMSLEDIRLKVKTFVEAHGKEVATKLLHQYSGMLTDLKPEDRPKLAADLDAYMPEEDDLLGGM